MKKIGLITYHAAYNFGSMLQALATQTILKRFFNNCKIINYRLPTQKRLYQLSKFDKKKNPKEFKEDVKKYGTLYEPRALRAKRYEEFLKHFNLTKEFNSFEPALKCMSEFDVLVSGSDQILNRNTGELSTLTIDYMRPYLVDVPNKNRISYASSFCNMQDSQLDEIAPYLRGFNHFSLREASWVEKIQKYCSTTVENVCDPTFLLTKDEWIKILKLKKRNNGEKYILFYTLYSYEQTKAKLDILFYKLGYLDIKIHVVAPFSNRSVADIDPRVVDCLSFGPVEFLEDLYNAMFVIPESFHGTTFCAIFNKRFVCPCGTQGPEQRKHDVLKSIGLEAQLRPNFWEISLKDIYDDIDYTKANKLIDERREKAFEYIKNAVNS